MCYVTIDNIDNIVCFSLGSLILIVWAHRCSVSSSDGPEVSPSSSPSSSSSTSAITAIHQPSVSECSTSSTPFSTWPGFTSRSTVSVQPGICLTNFSSPLMKSWVGSLASAWDWQFSLPSGLWHQCIHHWSQFNEMHLFSDAQVVSMLVSSETKQSLE